MELTHISRPNSSNKNKRNSYFCARFIAFIAAFLCLFFSLLLGSSRDNLIYGREVINHDKKPLPEKKNHERHQTAANYRKQILLEHRIIEQLNIICFPDIEGNG